MNPIRCILVFLIAASAALGQSAAQKIYDTERAFEKAVIEKGMNAAFVEFTTPDAIMFFPEAKNAHEEWKSRPASPAALTWNPILVDASENDVLGYSIGNSIYRAKGKDDPTGYSGHYISIWIRRPDGSYKAVLDTGITHAPPKNFVTEWKKPQRGGGNPKNISAADSTSGFYIAASASASKVYSRYLATDAMVMRDGFEPFAGKKAILSRVDKQPGTLSFAKRKSFVEAVDLAYVNSGYSVTDKSGKEIERGNFVHVWKFIDGRWQMVADVQIPTTKTSK